MSDDISKIRRVMPSHMVPDDLVGVAPMKGPVGLIKELREQYSMEDYTSGLHIDGRGSEVDKLPIVEDAPTNHAGAGAVAGIGVGPQGQPPISNKPKKKKVSNIIGDMMRRRMQDKTKRKGLISWP